MAGESLWGMQGWAISPAPPNSKPTSNKEQEFSKTHARAEEWGECATEASSGSQQLNLIPRLKSNQNETEIYFNYKSNWKQIKNIVTYMQEFLVPYLNALVKHYNTTTTTIKKVVKRTTLREKVTHITFYNASK